MMALEKIKENPPDFMEVGYDKINITSSIKVLGIRFIMNISRKVHFKTLLPNCSGFSLV